MSEAIKPEWRLREDLKALDRQKGEKTQRQRQYRQAERQKQRAHDNAVAPLPALRLKRNIYRTRMLLRAAKMATDAPGSLRQTFVTVAEPIALIDTEQTTAAYWSRVPDKHFYQSPFHSFFGFPDDPARCKDGHGVEGKLFDDATPHDPANIRAYIEMWLDELNQQLSALRSKHTQVEHFRGGATRTHTPEW